MEEKKKVVKIKEEIKRDTKTKEKKMEKEANRRKKTLRKQKEQDANIHAVFFIRTQFFEVRLSVLIFG